MPSSQDHTNLHESHYLTAKNELEELLRNEPLNSSKRECTQKVIKQIEKLKKDGKLPISDSTELLKNTKDLLSNLMTPDAYRAKAEIVQGSSSPGMKILGGLMIALGFVVTGLCIAIAATVRITLSGEGVIGAAILAAGLGLFSGGMRSGLSQAMNELADSAKPKVN